MGTTATQWVTRPLCGESDKYRIGMLKLQERYFKNNKQSGAFREASPERGLLLDPLDKMPVICFVGVNCFEWQSTHWCWTGTPWKSMPLFRIWWNQSLMMPLSLRPPSLMTTMEISPRLYCVILDDFTHEWRFKVLCVLVFLNSRINKLNLKSSENYTQYSTERIRNNCVSIRSEWPKLKGVHILDVTYNSCKG